MRWHTYRGDFVATPSQVPTQLPDRKYVIEERVHGVLLFLQKTRSNRTQLYRGHSVDECMRAAEIHEVLNGTPDA